MVMYFCSRVFWPFITKLEHIVTKRNFFKIVVLCVLSYVANGVSEEPFASIFMVEAHEWLLRNIGNYIRNYKVI
jgi:hypothetical protein